MINLNLTWYEAFGRLYGGAERKEPFCDLSIRKICGMTLTELRKMRGIGGRTAAEIAERLKKEGLALGMDVSAIEAEKPQLRGKYIELHGQSTDTPFLVNTHVISTIHKCEGGTTICLANRQELYARESYESIKEALTS